MKFKYAGPHDAVDVPELGLADVPRGGLVEATGAAAKSLESQRDWQKVADPKPRKKAAAPPEDPAEEPKD